MIRIFLHDSSPLRLDSMALLISSFPECAVMTKSYSAKNIFLQLEKQVIDVLILCSDKCDQELLDFLSTYKTHFRPTRLILITNTVSNWLVKHMKQFRIDGYVIMKGKSASL